MRPERSVSSRRSRGVGARSLALRPPVQGPEGPEGDRTIQNQAFALAMGTEVRRLRLARGMSLRDLASKTGLSPGFLSLVERGKSSIGMAALGAIAAALDTYMAALMPSPVTVDDEYRAPHVTRANAEPRACIRTPKFQYDILSSAWPGRTLEPMLQTYVPHTRLTGQQHGHAGEEFAYVLEGQLVYIVDGVETVLQAGDSIHLQSGVPHEVVNDTDYPARVLLVSKTRIL